MHLSAISPAVIILIAIAALLVFGPKKLPELGRAVGVTLREFKKGTKGLIDDDDDDNDNKKNVVIEQKTPQIEQKNVQQNVQPTDSKEKDNVK